MKKLSQLRRSRRRFVRAGGGMGVLGALLVAGLLRAEDVRAQVWNSAAFDSKRLSDVIRYLGGTRARESAEISLLAPEIAENGAVVPIQIMSNIPDTQIIAIAIEKNPRLLAASFEIPAGTLPDIQTRVKMAETCKVYALVRSAGAFHYTSKEIKVTAGGCGG